MVTISTNEDAVRRCVEFYNRRTIEFVELCYAETAEWIELPMPGRPAGRRGSRAYLREQQKALLMMFPDRRITIRNLVSQGDQVALEVDWQGTAAAAAGGVSAGAMLSLRIASFFTLAGGLIVRQTDYCVPIQKETAIV